MLENQVELQAGVKIEFVACGGAHSMCVTSDGSVLACGKNEYGRLGMNNEKNHLIMTPVPFFDQSLNAHAAIPRERVKMVACGGSHSVFLTTSGRVLVAGRGSSGRRGDGTGQSSLAPEPVLMPDVDESRETTFVAAGGQHSLMLYS